MSREDVANAQRHLWTIGDYSAVARILRPISVATIEALRLAPGDRVLDVGAGDGNSAIEAARRGARVTAIDLTPAQLVRARARCAEAGVDVDLSVGDAQALDFRDASFDVVVSVLGAIFAPDHNQAIAEMLRVVRPGGRVALVAWSGGGWFSEWRRAVRHLAPPPAPDAPRADDWGSPQEARRRFESAGLHDVTVEGRPFAWEFPSVDDCFAFLLEASGPFVAFMDSMRQRGRDAEARVALRGALEKANIANDGTCRLRAPWLLVVGRRTRQA
jgi:SAM-dependent methyltransferase